MASWDGQENLWWHIQQRLGGCVSHAGTTMLRENAFVSANVHFNGSFAAIRAAVGAVRDEEALRHPNVAHQWSAGVDWVHAREP